MPLSVSLYDYSGTKYATCKITAITSSWSSNGICELTIYGECTYNLYGTMQSSNLMFGYKVYDSDGYVVDSGTAVTEAIAVGDKFKETIVISGLPSGTTRESYTLQLLGVN